MCKSSGVRFFDLDEEQGMLYPQRALDKEGETCLLVRGVRGTVSGVFLPMGRDNIYFLSDGVLLAKGDF